MCSSPLICFLLFWGNFPARYLRLMQPRVRLRVCFLFSSPDTPLIQTQSSLGDVRACSVINLDANRLKTHPVSVVILARNCSIETNQRKCSSTRVTLVTLVGSGVCFWLLSRQVTKRGLVQPLDRAVCHMYCTNKVASCYRASNICCAEQTMCAGFGKSCTNTEKRTISFRQAI